MPQRRQYCDVSASVQEDWYWASHKSKPPVRPVPPAITLATMSALGPDKWDEFIPTAECGTALEYASKHIEELVPIIVYLARRLAGRSHDEIIEEVLVCQ